MIPWIIQSDTEHLQCKDLRLVGFEDQESSIEFQEATEDEVLAAIDETWEQDEEAYRYLGR